MACSRFRSTWRFVTIATMTTVLLLTRNSFALGRVPQLSSATALFQIANWLTLSPGVCDFNQDGKCNVNDLNDLFAQGDLTFDVQVPDENQYDLDNSLTLNEADITLWLADAAAFNGFSTPYRRGDIDGLGTTYLDVIDVDLTDFATLAANFGPGPKTWDQGNFDGDNDIDLTDFGMFASNFSEGNYGLPIPEPATGQLAMMCLAGIGWLLSGRRL